MSSTVTCQSCRQSFAAQPHLYGKTVACPSCLAALTIPDPNAQAAFDDPLGDLGPLDSLGPLDNVDPLQASLPNAASYQMPSHAPTHAPRASTRKSSSNSNLKIFLISCAIGFPVLMVVCGGIFAMVFKRVAEVARSASNPAQSEHASLLDGRSGFRTTLIRLENAGYPAPQPPPALFNLEKYRSPAGELAAYVSPSGGAGQKRPAMIWVFGGFDNSIGETAWEPASPENDQSARAFREAGFVMMYPSFRGGNMNPGHLEAFYGEVDDLLAAADHLAKKDYVDTQRIYLGGHSTGGTMVMLAAAATDRFRAVFAFGPIDDVRGYGSESLPFNAWKDDETRLRNPIQWLHAMKSPLFVFEGSAGNASCLRSMRRASTNSQLHFFEVRPADHFNILAPVTTLIAEKLRQDTGPTCNTSFTDAEISGRF